MVQSLKRLLLASLAAASLISGSFAQASEPNSTISDSNSTSTALNSTLLWVDLSEDAHSDLHSDAVALWERGGGCHTGYFNFDDKETRAASDFAGFYDRQVKLLAKKYPEEYTREGEAALFAKHAAHLPNFSCDVDAKRCGPVPSCAEIGMNIDRQWKEAGKEYSPAHVVAYTQKVYFWFLGMDYIWKTMGNMNSALDRAQMNNQALTATVVKDFTQHADPRSEHFCDIATFRANQVRTVLWQFLLLGGSFNWEMALGEFLSNYQSLSAEGEALDKKEKLDRLREEVLEDMATLNNRKHLVLPVTLPEAGFCNKFGGGLKHEDVDRNTAMDKFTAETFQAMRQGVRDFMAALLRGDLEDPEYPGRKMGALAMFLNRPYWAETMKDLAEIGSSFERKMTSLFTETLISASWANSHCYVKCQDTTGIRRDETACDRHWPNNKDSRYCTANAECQVNCLTPRSPNTRENDLIGKDKLESLTGTPLKKGIEDSYFSHEKYGNDLRGLQDDVLDDTASLLDRVANNRSGIVLPVCKSVFTRLTESDNSVTSDAKESNHQFPCTCGDGRSNETEAFLSAIGLGKFQRDYQDPNIRNLFGQLCPDVLRWLPPLNRYLAYCNLNIRMPSEPVNAPSLRASQFRDAVPDADAHRNAFNERDMILGQSDRFCAAILEETSSFPSLTSVEANDFFCHESVWAKELFKNEWTWADNQAHDPKKNVHGHKHSCEDWDGNSRRIGWGRRELRGGHLVSKYDMRNWPSSA